jgi:hypothetical protein
LVEALFRCSSHSLGVLTFDSVSPAGFEFAISSGRVFFFICTKARTVAEPSTVCTHHDHRACPGWRFVLLGGCADTCQNVDRQRETTYASSKATNRIGIPSLGLSEASSYSGGFGKTTSMLPSLFFSQTLLTSPSSCPELISLVISSH